MSGRAPDGRDARRQVLELTASGYGLHDRLIALATAREEMMLADFTPEERAQFTALLRRIHARLPELRDFRPEAEREEEPSPSFSGEAKRRPENLESLLIFTRNHRVIPGQAAGLSPEPMNTVSVG